MRPCDRCGELWWLDPYHVGPNPEHRRCEPVGDLQTRLTQVRDYPPWKGKWFNRSDAKYKRVVFAPRREAM